MKNKKIIPILISLLLLGCTSNQGTQNKSTIEKDPFLEQTKEQEIQEYSFQQGPVKDGVLTYKDGKAHVDYEIENYGNEVTFGFLLFVNNKLQDYTIGDTTTYMKLIKTKSEEKKTFHISFIPDVGTEDKTFSVRYGLILNPKIISSVKGIGHNHKISTTIAHEEKVSKTSTYKMPVSKVLSNQKAMTKNDIKKYNSDSTSNVLMSNTFIEFYQNKKQIVDTFDNKQAVDVQLCGKQGKYTFFILEDALPTTDIQYYDVNMKSNTFHTVTVNLKKNTKNFMGVLVPYDPNERVNFSGPMVYENEQE